MQRINTNIDAIANARDEKIQHSQCTKLGAFHVCQIKKYPYEKKNPCSNLQSTHSPGIDG